MVLVLVSQALFCDTCRVAQKVQKSGITTLYELIKNLLKNRLI